MRRWLVLALAACCLGLGACASGPAGGPTGDPLAPFDTGRADPGTGRADPADHVAGSALGGRHSAELHVVSGAGTVQVHMSDLGSRLYRATTPPESDVVPSGSVSEDVVTLSLSSHGHHGPVVLDVSLSSRVAWRVRLDGGAADETVDATGGRLRELDLSAGAGSIDVSLPDPRGTVPIRMSGGVGSLMLHLPDGVPARVRFNGGAGAATIDGEVHAGIGGAAVLDALDWAHASDRYTVDNTAGVASFLLDRRR